MPYFKANKNGPAFYIAQKITYQGIHKITSFAIISQNLCDEDLSLFYTWKNYVALLLFLLLPFVTMARILPKKYFSRQQ